MKKTNQSGFSVVEVLLVLILLAILGFTGYYVYHAQQNANKTLDTAKKTASSPVQPIKKKITASAKQYLVIKEWGVKIPLSALDAGAYYEVDGDVQQSTTNPTNLTAYASEADELTGPAGVSCKGEYVAYLMRLPKDDPKWQPSVTEDDGNVSPLFSERIVVGDYRYAVATKKQYGPACFETSKTGDYSVDTLTAQKFADIVMTFTTDFKSITAQ